MLALPVSTLLLYKDAWVVQFQLVLVVLQRLNVLLGLDVLGIRSRQIGFSTSKPIPHLPHKRFSLFTRSLLFGKRACKFKMLKLERMRFLPAKAIADD